MLLADGRCTNASNERIAVIKLAKTVCIALSAVLIHKGSVAAVTVDDFCVMSIDDQRAFVRDSLTRWRDGSRNVSVQTTTIAAVVPAPNGVIAEGAEDFVAKYTCSLFRCGGDYRTAIAWYRYSEDDKQAILTQNVESNFHVNTGHVHSWTTDFQHNIETWGRIGTKANGLVECNRYMYWFDPHFGSRRDFTMTEAIRNCDNSSVSFARNNLDGIDMKCQIKYPGSLVSRTHVYSLDPHRDWFPTCEHQRMDGPNGWWFEQVTTVDEMRSIKGMWYPWRVTMKNMNNTGAAEGHSAKWTTTVSSLTVGDVTEKDLEVRFPTGAIVYDEIGKEGIRSAESSDLPTASQSSGSP